MQFSGIRRASQDASLRCDRDTQVLTPQLETEETAHTGAPVDALDIPSEHLSQ